MKRILLLSVLVILAASLAACSGAAPSGYVPSRSLSVSGTGEVTTTPDKVTIAIGVQTNGEDVAQAVAENNRLTAAVQEAIVASGVSAAEIQTTYFSVWNTPIYDPAGGPTGQVTYYVDNTVTATLRDPSKLGAMLQAALSAGANTVQGITFGVSDTKPFEDQARQKAMDDAMARAQMMATAAGIRLGKLISVSTSVSYPASMPYYAYADGRGGGGGGAPPISSGTAEIEASVNLVYEIAR
jgi:hypothetical protein